MTTMAHHSTHNRLSPVDGVVPITHTPVTAEAFKQAFRRHPGGVAVITADPGDGPVALTATSVSSISAEPPLLLFSVSDLSSSTPGILRSQAVVVHLINAAELRYARLAATSGIDRFADPSIWSRLPDGEPYYPGVENRLRCRIDTRITAGASTIVVAEVLETSALEGEVPAPLVHVNRQWHRLGEPSRIDA